MTRSFKTVFILLTTFLTFLSSVSCKKEPVGVTGIYFTNIQKGSVSITEGETFRVKYIVEPHELQETAEIEWSSSKKSVASVNDRGRVLAVGIGKTSITATCGSASASFTLIVEPVPATSFSIPASMDVFIDKKVPVEVTELKPDNTGVETIDWTISDGSVATFEIVENGLWLTGHSLGTAKLTGKCENGTSQSCNLVVKRYVKPTSVKISSGAAKLEYKQNLSVGLAVEPADASVVDVLWTVEPSDLATFDPVTRTLKAGGTEGKVVLSAMVSGVKSNDLAIDIVPPAPANCYIVKEPGIYSFRPLQGNSNTSVGAVAGVKVLWESVRCADVTLPGEMIESVSYANGMINYTVAEGAKSGNALIAAVNASGTVLWSWHIWYQPDTIKEYRYPNGVVMMDRNLGAWDERPDAAVDKGFSSFGLLYQWGRKDPFRAHLVSEGDYANQMNVGPGSKENTLSYAISNPTHFITRYNDSDDDWMVHDGSTNYKARWSSSVKTLYDPCPSGWKVPSRNAWEGIDEEDLAYESVNSYEHVIINSPTGDRYYYPYPVALRGDALSWRGYQICDWNDEYDRPCCFRCDYSSYWRMFTLGISESDPYVAMQVRCCRE